MRFASIFAASTTVPKLPVEAVVARKGGVIVTEVPNVCDRNILLTVSNRTAFFHFQATAVTYLPECEQSNIRSGE
jgi:hypothetical protein